MSPDPVFTLNALLFLAVAIGVLSNITVIVVSLKGRPAVKKDEFEKYQEHVGRRFDGTNNKIDELDSTVSIELKTLTNSLGHINSDLQRVVGRLEGQLSHNKNRRVK